MFNTMLRRNSSGSVLTEFLMVLGIVCMLVPSLALSLNVLSQCDTFDEMVQDQISIAQLRRVLMISYDVFLQQDCLTYTYAYKEYVLSCKNGRLTQQPGTLIYLSEIEDAWFVQEQELIYLVYERGGHSRKVALCHA